MINKKNLLVIVIMTLIFTTFIPNAKSIKEKVYLEGRDETSIYILETVEGDLIYYEFRTYDDPFICELRCLEWSTYVSSHDTSDKGIVEVLESGNYRFRFEKASSTGGGYFEFELKIIKRIPGYYPILIIFMVACVSTIIILISKKKLKSIKRNINY